MAPLADLVICLRFFSRLPLPASQREADLGPAALAQAVAGVPLAGAIIALLPGAVLLAAQGLALPSQLAAALAIATLVLVTGALHEDGLADCADGFGGGRTRERKLAIMRDSRIGTFGACAIGLALYLRVTALAVIASHAPWRAATTLVVAAAVSRTACLLPLVVLPPARTDGLGNSAGRPSPRRYAAAVILAFGLSALLWGAGVDPARVGVADLAGAVSAVAFCALARRQIGGQTGDIAGATQQIVEIAMLLAIAAMHV
jgi:adenosylcobinamide-GDP ribazoletransferase